MKYETLVKEILANIGTDSNVESLTHCMTRLRFVLKDDSKADVEKIKTIDGVIGCVNAGGQLQIVIGTNVSDVYKEIIKSTSIKDLGIVETSTENNKNIVNRFFDTVAAIFMPIVGALAGAGMVKAILSVLVFFQLIDTTSQTYILLYMISDTVFYYLPFFLAFSAAKRLKCNPFLSLVFAGMLLHPTFLGLKEAGEAVKFLGITVKTATYSSSVMPILLIVAFQSYVERLAEKISPKAIKVFFVPMLVILITAPIGLIVLGPFGNILGGYLSTFFMFLDTKASWVVPTLVGGFAPLLVMTGMHYSLGAAQATQRATVGYATILAPGMMSSNMSQAAATFAVSLRTKNPKLRSLASSCAATAICGVTEPALYGVNMKLKRPLYATMIAGGCAGFYAGITGVRAWSAGTSNIFALPIYIGPDNSFLNICITVAIALTLGFVLSFIMFKEPEEFGGTKDNAPSNSINKKIEIKSPLQGQVIPLGEVNDEAFSSGALGKGIAVIPANGEVLSPVSGKVAMLFETKHAIGLISEEGAEVLIHIGIDTVNLKGQYFTAHVATGDTVTVGQPIITFDLKAIKEKGYDSVTSILISNSNDYMEVVESNETVASKNTTLLTVIR